MIGRGVPAGASATYQDVMSNPSSPTSAMVGTSGISGVRVALHTASARRVPSLMNGMVRRRVEHQLGVAGDHVVGPRAPHP